MKKIKSFKYVGIKDSEHSIIFQIRSLKLQIVLI
jgi:hypothetical protein